MVLRSPRAACQKSRGRPDPVRARCLRPRDHRLVGRGERRYLRRDGTRSHGRCTPHPVEWLSDNGSAYIAKDTADIARALGLTLLFTPVRSPESNGISESFVKTLKRDYARLPACMMPTQSLQCSPIGSKIIARSTRTPA